MHVRRIGLEIIDKKEQRGKERERGRLGKSRCLPELGVAEGGVTSPCFMMHHKEVFLIFSCPSKKQAL